MRKDKIVEWIKEYFNANGPQSKAVIGISGGKDSSVVAALCVEALGKDRVYGVLMPCGEQPDIDVAYDLVNHLGIEHTVINIKPTVEALRLSLIDNLFSLSEQTLVNLPARIRMTTLYGVAQTIGGRVANTCNKSEDWIGYSTKYGDAAGDFSPLAEYTVSEVKAIGRELGLPEKFIEKVPSDGLCGKTDEENLGFTYDELDKYIMFGIVSEHQNEIDRKHLYNLHKMRLMPRCENDNPHVLNF